MNNKKIVKCLLKNEKGNYLAIKESKDREKETAGKWEIPGGKIKPSETRYEAGSRELKEETNITANPEKAKDVVRIQVETKDNVDCYIIFYPEFEGKPEIKEGSKHSKYKWVTADEFKDLDWHTDAGYDFIPMKKLDSYLNKEHNY